MWIKEVRSARNMLRGQFLWNPLGTSIGHPKIRVVVVYLGLKK
jgi:hypothetical protein